MSGRCAPPSNARSIKLAVSQLQIWYFRALTMLVDWGLRDYSSRAAVSCWESASLPCKFWFSETISDEKARRQDGSVQDAVPIVFS
jgi:hypothetical protein